MSALTPRPGIMKISPYVPGKDSVDGKEPIAKLSSNEGALGPSPKAMAAYAKAAAELHRYPDGGTEKLRAAIGRHYGLDPNRIVCGCGSDELLNLLIRACARSSKPWRSVAAPLPRSAPMPCPHGPDSAFKRRVS